MTRAGTSLFALRAQCGRGARAPSYVVARFLIALIFLQTFLMSAGGQPKFSVATIDRARVLKAANKYLSEKPITITTSTSPRSAGGPHDFFRRRLLVADPQNLKALIQRGGMTSRTIRRHRRALICLGTSTCWLRRGADQDSARNARGTCAPG